MLGLVSLTVLVKLEEPSAATGRDAEGKTTLRLLIDVIVYEEWQASA